jgi:hypothetical protein
LSRGGSRSAHATVPQCLWVGRSSGVAVGRWAVAGLALESESAAIEGEDARDHGDAVVHHPRAVARYARVAQRDGDLEDAVGDEEEDDGGEEEVGVEPARQPHHEELGRACNGEEE